MVEPVGKIDRPEPRWQAVLALLAVGGIYVALPRALIVGPKWALPVFIVVLLTPTVVAHRTGKLSWNRTLGIIISSVITLALIASVGLLVAAVPAHKETPVELLSSGAELWLTNVLVFALWYWRLDGGGPTLRQQGANSAAAVSSSHRCKSRKPSAVDSNAADGDRILSITFLLRLRKARPLVQLTRHCWRDGPKFWLWSRSASP